MKTVQTEGTELQKEEQYLQEVICFADRRIEELRNKQSALQDEMNSQAKVLREEVTQLIKYGRKKKMGKLAEDWKTM